MLDIALLFALVILVAAVLVVQVLTLRRRVVADVSQIQTALAAIEKACERAERTARDEIARNRDENAAAARSARDELASRLKDSTDSLAQRLVELTALQAGKLDGVVEQIAKLTQSNELRLEAVRATVEAQLQHVRDDNRRSLDSIRTAVDEKLQGALEKRLGESFRLVSQQLEQVHKGLGEMQALAAGVGDLKRVLSNVKSRGMFGETQLSAMLEQALTPEQYAVNVDVKGIGERVEFAVRLPGPAEHAEDVVWLPIDAKFPMEPYERLVAAQEQADVAAVDEAGRQLAAQIRFCAQTICDKYINPPATTDFAILFLPVEGLFAEVMRQPGLGDAIQRQQRVMIAGPTTLWALLNSLQMGFRTLAIQRRSSEVWNLLASVKAEWQSYGEVLAKVQKKLQEASNSVDLVERRSRAIGRRLRAVEQLPSDGTSEVLPLQEPAESEA
ncbi:RmuC family protein [Phycisphaerae bacterium RAS1]|nr:RmuC family protein [Phycisphaerae bacterium RAS1]